MADYTFGPWLATDGDDPVAGAVGQVYAPTDDAFASPLPVFDLNGLALDDVRSGSMGIIPAFVVADHPVVIWKSGSHELPVASWQGMLEDVAGARSEAQAARGAAEQSATAAADTKTAADAAASSAANAASAAQAAAEAAGSALPPIPVVEAPGDYTVTAEDVGHLIEFTGGAAATLTLPTDAEEPFAVGASVTVRQYGTGSVIVQGASGVTVRSRGDAFFLGGQYAEAMVTKRSATEWVVTGDVSNA